jgi:hypothetical protein
MINTRDKIKEKGRIRNSLSPTGPPSPMPAAGDRAGPASKAESEARQVTYLGRPDGSKQYMYSSFCSQKTLEPPSK